MDQPQLNTGNRIEGLDFARSIAIYGMIVVNFSIVFGGINNGSLFLRSFENFLSGKAAATFVTLAGIGITLMAKNAIASKDPIRINKTRKTIFKRAIFLFVFGLLYSPLWPADILHFYGVYLLGAGLLITASSSIIITIAIIMPLIYVLLNLIFDYSTGWDFSTLTYLDFWTIKGMFRHIFFNGFHPVIPWISFLLFGMIIGRYKMSNYSIQVKLVVFGLILFIIGELSSRILISMFSNVEDIEYLFGTGPMPPFPFYIMVGLGSALIVIGGSLLIERRWRETRLFQSFKFTGQIALTNYVAHVVIGMGIPILIYTLNGREDQIYSQSISIVLIYSTLFFALSIVFSVIWRAKYSRGPLESIMRKVTR